MMTLPLLGLDPLDLETRGASWTAREIEQQPAVWGKVAALIRQRRSTIDAFLAPLLADPQLRIVLTGAGTSAFIGECLAPALLRQLSCAVEAVPTTDLVAGPDRYLRRDAPLLLVSFGRSGSSPESVAAFDLAEQMAGRCHHLVLTCNADGALYRRCQSQDNALAIALPDETHDRAFAMTSSFTAMLLAAASAWSTSAATSWPGWRARPRSSCWNCRTARSWPASTRRSASATDRKPWSTSAPWCSCSCRTIRTRDATIWTCCASCATTAAPARCWP